MMVILPIVLPVTQDFALYMDTDKPLKYEGPDKRKCPAHNFWMRKGQCELCLRERDLRQQEYAMKYGSNKQKVKIGKL